MKITKKKRSTDLKRITTYAIVINALQIAAMSSVVVSLLLSGRIDNYYEGTLLAVCTVIVLSGAVFDIIDAIGARRLGEERELVADSLRLTEELNLTLRKQRHDFMNHLQVVFGLIELDQKDEARSYVERIYGDIRKVGHFMKTAHPALNAIIAAKSADCEAKHIRFTTDISSGWEGIPVPAWELCRVFGNLLDNAIEALEGTRDPEITFRLSEGVAAYTFAIEDNGPALPDEEAVFKPGYTTKADGHGMGLAIVKDILTGAGGMIEGKNTPGKTVFSGSIPRKNN